MTKLDKSELGKLAKSEIDHIAESLDDSDVDFLVQILLEKEDNLRYNAFLLLQSNSRLFPYVHRYWDELEGKLSSDNSYQRSIGLMLIAENVKWDKEGRFDKTLANYLGCCLDEKFITARQAIQGLARVLDATDSYDRRIGQNLSRMDFSQYKENQQKLLKKDAAAILRMIEKKEES